MPSDRHLLRAYIVGSGPRANGDEDMTCPLHEDARRSATINFREGIWNCHAGCGGGKIADLIEARELWVPPGGAADPGFSLPNSPSTASNSFRPSLPTPARLAGYSARLEATEGCLEFLIERRGLEPDTIRTYGLGWNGRRYVVPIYDADGELVNVRYYAPDGKPKWINEKGHGSPARLYPIDVISRHKTLFWVEGEMDALLTNQTGIPAFTSTGGAKIVWQPEWDDILRDKHIVTCFDADRDGRLGVRRVSSHLKRVAASHNNCRLPYKVVQKHGKDITDFWLGGGTADKLYDLIEVSDEVEEIGYQPVGYDALREPRVKDRPVSFQGTVSSIEGPSLLMPDEVVLRCSQDWKPVACAVCPLGKRSGEARWTFEPEDEVHLNLLENQRRRQRNGIIADACGIPHGCPKVEVDWQSINAWHGEIRNGSNMSSDALPILLFQQYAPNIGTNVELQGQVKAGPRQASLFVAANSKSVSTELDTFQLSPAQVYGIKKIIEELPVENTRDPRQQLDKIAELTEEHITRRFGQRWLHICTDLVYHSVCQFPFQGELLDRGWIECLAVGETRSGKSSMIKAYQTWYERGEIVPCEKISIAGLISTSERRSGLGKDNWVSRLGRFPLCDRKLMILDESQGLTPEQIGQLSDARSSGIVKVTQASQLETTARVRLIWLANPRRDGETGVRALATLMGKTEDLARVDLPLYLRQEMSAEDKERWSADPPAIEDNPLNQRLMQALLDWAWSRKPEDIEWGAGTVAEIQKVADRMADKYHSTIPLMPRNEARVRVARLAVAIAARLFSTDKHGRVLKVLTKHVHAAGWVYANLLKHEDLEYIVETRDAKLADEAAEKYQNELAKLIHDYGYLSSMLRQSEVDIRMVQQLAGSNSDYIVGRLHGMSVLQLTKSGYIVSNWARRVAQER